MQQKLRTTRTGNNWPRGTNLHLFSINVDVNLSRNFTWSEGGGKLIINLSNIMLLKDNVQSLCYKLILGEHLTSTFFILFDRYKQSSCHHGVGCF